MDRAGTGVCVARASSVDGILLVLIRPPAVVVAALGTLWSHEDVAEGNRSILGISCIDLELDPLGFR